MRKLTVDDIVDLRAYERERAEFRQHIIELKKTRLGLGAKANHLAYLGDAIIGAKVNVGAEAGWSTR